jgi:hypothetical protein
MDNDLAERAKQFAKAGRAEHLKLVQPDECATIELRDVPPPGDVDVLVRVLARMVIAACRKVEAEANQQQAA